MKTLNIKAIASGNTAAVIVNGQAYTVTDSHPAFKRIKDAIQRKRFQKLADLMDIKTAVATYAKNFVEIKGNKVLVDGKEVHGSVVDRIVTMLHEGEDATSLIEFFKNLLKNPTEFVRTDLFNFLQHQNIPLTPDGCFLAYKRVNEDYTDMHTGKFDNSLGKVVSMKRSACDLDRTECSTGLHVAALPYARDTYHSGSGRLIIVKVSPEDVTAVPPDYSGMKLRTCRYEVVEDYVAPLKGSVVKKGKKGKKAVTTNNQRRTSKMSTEQAKRFLIKRGYTEQIGTWERSELLESVLSELDTQDDS